MEELSRDDFIEMIRAMREKIEKNKDYLSRLDTQIGDGDHGFSMASGFTSFVKKIEEYRNQDIGGILKKGGIELIKTIGGAAGAVFGTFFTGQASYYEKNLKGKDSVSLREFAGMLTEALEQIQKRGNAVPGDKTMVDALHPAVQELLRCEEQGLSFSEALGNAAEKAKAGAESTRDMVGKRGRSKYLADRAKGYLDAGAMSTALIFEAMSEFVSPKG